MEFATTTDGVKLHVEDTGSGTAIVFVHEFGGDQQSWEPQVQYLSRLYRCVTFNARGYSPSDIPEDVASYSQRRAVDDIRDVMDHLKIENAHIIGLSMGGFAALHFGMLYPRRARSLVVGGVGYGVEKEFTSYFKGVSLEVARQFELQGSETFSKVYGLAASRISFLLKNPRGWAEFRRGLARFSERGAANTMRGVQAERPSLYDLEDQLAKMAVPSLIIAGDEDDHCLLPGIFLKRTIPACGLLVLPKTGHTMNLEEPDLFNRSVADFLSLVEQDRWLPRDPRSKPSEIMKTE
jgi:pimeloyl-ACP methyl ester carboxylesterase